MIALDVRGLTDWEIVKEIEKAGLGRVAEQSLSKMLRRVEMLQRQGQSPIGSVFGTEVVFITNGAES